MLRKQQWLILLICGLGLYLLSSRWLIRQEEAFQDQQTQTLINQINSIASSANQKGPDHYKTFMGYIYEHPEKSQDVMNDLKKRAFTDKCLFRTDWKEGGAQGLGPLGGGKPEAATAAYNLFLQCLADGNHVCKRYLEDVMKRWFIQEDACRYKIVDNGREYARDLTAKFQ